MLHPYIFKTYAHPASLLQCFLCCKTTFLASLASWITSVAVTHLQSLTTGLRPGTGQLTYFRRLSTSNLFALNSVRVIIPKSDPSCAEKWSLDLDVFLFSNARWLFDHCHLQLSKQSVSVTLQISFNIYRQLLCGNFLVKTDDNYHDNNAHLLNFRYLLFFSTSGFLISVSSSVNIHSRNKRTTYSWTS
jgi:hypothetical protein